MILLLIFWTNFAISCEPNQIYVRSHQVASYTKMNGKIVNSYKRTGYCKEIIGSTFFEDKTALKVKEKVLAVKKWSELEKQIFLEEFAKIPSWLARYSLKEALRTESGGSDTNPATTYALSKTVVLHDSFFKMKNKRDVIIHEMSHIAIFDFSAEQIFEFATLSGWSFERKLEKITKRIPPSKTLLDDSSFSIDEDFANHIEVFYSNPDKIKKENIKMFDFLQAIIKSKDTK